MLKLGEYHEDEAREVAKYLRDAGMKVDIRTFTDCWPDFYYYLEGHMTEMKDIIDNEEFEDHERYIAALRSVLSKGVTLENFGEMFQMELDPEVEEKRQRIRDIVEDNLPIEADLTEEELRIKKLDDFSTLMTDLTKISNGDSFVRRLLYCNNIRIGEDVGDRLDNPIVQILVDPEEVDENWTIRETTIFTFAPQAEIYIDEFSATLVDKLDEEFEEVYNEEFLKIEYMADIISNLMDFSSGKTEMEEFSKKCAFKIKDDGDILAIDGRSAAQDIARSLEKNGVIKVKGDIIKWKH